MSGLRNKVEEFYADVVGMHHRALDLTADVRQAGPSGFSDEDITDVGFLMRESEELLKDAGKACGSTKLLLGQVIYTRVAADAVNTGNVRLEGKLASATPDVQVKPRIPAVSSPKYAEMLRHFGVPEKTIRHGVLVFKFQALMDMFNDMAKRGENPPAIGTFNDFTCVFRRKNAPKVTEDEVSHLVAVTDDQEGSEM